VNEPASRSWTRPTIENQLKSQGYRKRVYSAKKRDREFRHPNPDFERILNRSRTHKGLLDTGVLFRELQKPASDLESHTSSETVVQKPPKPIRTSSEASTTNIREWASKLYEKSQDNKGQWYRKSYTFSIVTDEPVTLQGETTGKTYAIVPEGATIKADSHIRGKPGEQTYQSRKQTQTVNLWLSTFVGEFEDLKL
jgi:hypothetical protein